MSRLEDQIKSIMNKEKDYRAQLEASNKAVVQARQNELSLVEKNQGRLYLGRKNSP